MWTGRFKPDHRRLFFRGNGTAPRVELFYGSEGWLRVRCDSARRFILHPLLTPPYRAVMRLDPLALGTHLASCAALSLHIARRPLARRRDSRNPLAPHRAGSNQRTTLPPECGRRGKLVRVKIASQSDQFQHGRRRYRIIVIVVQRLAVGAMLCDGGRFCR
jgi:hypothetical protein